MKADLFKNCLATMDLAWFAVFGICFLLFFIFFLLGTYLFRVRFLPLMLFLISFACLFGTPFAIAYSSKLFLHKIEILENNSKPLLYSDSFLLDVQFKNQGRLTFKKCLAVITSQRKQGNLKNKILDKIKPLQRVEYAVNAKIKRNEIYSIQTILPFNLKENPYNLELDCR